MAVLCPACGRELDDRSKVCLGCGKELAPQSPDGSASGAPGMGGRRRRLATLGVVVLVVLAGTAAAFLALRTHRGAPLAGAPTAAAVPAAALTDFPLRGTIFEKLDPGEIAAARRALDRRIADEERAAAEREHSAAAQ